MLDLALLPDDYAICRLPPGKALPSALLELAGGSHLVSVTWTTDEVSILCPAEFAPEDAAVETPWRCIRVAGPVDLALTGILASIVNPLGEARVNVFAFSTYDTDYVLVPAVRLTEAMAALTAAGHRVSS